MPSPHLPPNIVASRSTGFALLLVIWVLALLSVLALGLAADTHSEDQATHVMVARARARAAADAGVTLALLELIGSFPGGEWPVDGTPETIHYDNRDISVTVEDEGGKIDLNRAPPDLIAGLLNELAGDDDRRGAVLDGIMKRRQDFVAAAIGIAAPTPVGQGGPGSVPLGTLPFAAVSELRLVAGMSDELYARLRPYVTVYTQSMTIDPASARRETLLAVPGLSPAEIDRYLAARAAIADEPGEVVTQPLSAGRGFLAGNPLRAATITATATEENGVTFAREAVVAITPGGAEPYGILQWTHPPDSEAPEPRD